MTDNTQIPPQLDDLGQRLLDAIYEEHTAIPDEVRAIFDNRHTMSTREQHDRLTELYPDTSGMLDALRMMTDSIMKRQQLQDLKRAYIELRKAQNNRITTDDPFVTPFNASDHLLPGSAANSVGLNRHTDIREDSEQARDINSPYPQAMRENAAQAFDIDEHDERL